MWPSTPLLTRKRRGRSSAGQKRKDRLRLKDRSAERPAAPKERLRYLFYLLHSPSLHPLTTPASIFATTDEWEIPFRKSHSILLLFAGRLLMWFLSVSG